MDTDILKGFKTAEISKEKNRLFSLENEAKALVNLPPELDGSKPVNLIFYALPRDMSITQAVGDKINPEPDTGFTPQNIGLQVQEIREKNREKDFILIYLQSDEMSWTEWKEKHRNHDLLIRGYIEFFRDKFLNPGDTISLISHSAGGNFVLGYLDSVRDIPAQVSRIAFIDSNYSYEGKHGRKILNWLKSSEKSHLALTAYDDRSVKVNGQLIVGENSTYRKSIKMVNLLKKHFKFKKEENQELLSFRNNQIIFRLYKNPGNEMMHSELVGVKEGFKNSFIS